MPDVVQLGRKVKNKYPGVYDDLPDGVVGQKVKAKYPGAYDDFTDTTYTPPPPEAPGILGNLSTGFKQLGQKVSDVGASAYEIGREALHGNFAPLKETAEITGRATLPYLAGAANSRGPGAAFTGMSAAQAPAIEAVKQRQTARREASGDVYFRGSAIENAKLAAEAAKDPSLLGKLTRGAPQVLPYIGAGVATGGSGAAMAATGALMELNAPENIPLAAGLAAVPVPVGQAFKAGVNAVRRTFGKGAAQIIEAEAGPALAAEVAPTGGQASPAVQRAMQQFEQEVQRIKTLPPAQQAAEMEAAIQRVSSEASGVRPVSADRRAGYPPLMEFPENPNAVQMAGRLPGEASGASMRGPSNVAPMDTAPPPLSAEIGAPQFGVKAAPDLGYTETVGPSVSAPMNLDAAISSAAETVPRSRLQAAVGNILEPFRLLRAVLSSGDISAPFRQGAILTLPPSQWGKAAKAGVRMFQAFRTKNYEQIAEAIAAHPDAAVAQDAGLYLASQAKQLGKGEEYFLSRYADRIPIVKQSEQAYKTYLDSLRMDTFSRYKAAIDKAGLSPEKAQAAYTKAADWINITTGRGGFGKTIDKALPVLNEIFFAPRNLASRLNVLNPVMYARNAATAEGRAVLKEQMKDLAQFGGMVAATYQLAKAGGAQVSLDPNSPDFLKIRAGNFRYDPLAGLQQVMRLYYRTGAELGRDVQGEKSTGPDALDIAGRFLRAKLAPVPSFFVDFVKGRTVTGEKFNTKDAILDRTLPLQWGDFLDAYRAEGFPGVAKSLPGAVGVGVQRYESNPVDAAIERAQPLFTELKRLGKQVSDLRKTTKQEFKNGKWVTTENEDDASFNRRVQQFGQNYTQYGLQLLDSPRFRQAPDSVKVLALDALNERAKQLTKAEFPFPELALDANTLMDSAEASAAKRNPATK